MVLPMDSTAPPSPPTIPAAPALTPEAYLSQSVTQWVGRQQGIPPDQVQMQPLDPRVKVQACARPLNIDLPFSSAQTVRVRCPEPVWQLYVQVQTAAPDGRASRPSPEKGATPHPYTTK